MNNNYHAIGGGDVARREHRAVSSTRVGTIASKVSRCKKGIARVFTVIVQILISITRVAVEF
jgi:hypothetical protein